MFKHSVFASIFCAVRYPNIPRECKERQIFEAFTICTDDDDDDEDVNEDYKVDNDDDDPCQFWRIREDERVRISSL